MRRLLRDLGAAALAAAVLAAGLAPAGGAAQRRHPAVVWAVGDGADGSARAKALARRITAGHPRRFIYLGDVYPRGTADDFRERYHAVYGRFDRIAAPTPGNRDWPLHEVGYDPYWARARGWLGHYYSFSLAGWQVISLNSEEPHDPGSPQFEWLTSQLRGRGNCRLAFWHRPHYSAGPHGDQSDIEPFWWALEGHARIVLNGHDHNLQRFPTYRGIAEFIAGAGGSELFGPFRDPRLEFGDGGENGALRLVLRRRSASYRFVTASGRTLDQGTVRCNR